MPQHAAGNFGDAYAGIAQWYDADYDAFADDRQFYRDLAAGAGHNIIEVGCGTGRVTLPLARMGRTITGIDASPAMLARCHDRLAGEPVPPDRERCRVLYISPLKALTVDVDRNRSDRSIFDFVVEAALAEQLVELPAPLRDLEPAVLHLLEPLRAGKIVRSLPGEEYVRAMIEQVTCEADRSAGCTKP